MSRVRLALLAAFIGGGISVGLLLQGNHQQRAPVALKRAFDRRCRGGCDSLSGGGGTVTPVPFLRVLAGDGGTWNMAAGTLVTSDGGATSTTRASAKFCADSAGLLHALSSNQPCVDPSGLNIEPAATNVMLRSQSYVSNTAWSGLNNNVILPVVTDNTTDVTAPDGTSTASKMVYPAVSGASSYSVMAQSITTAAGTFTWSVYLRTLTGTAQTYIARGDSTTEPATLCSITTTWTRCTLTMTLTAAAHSFQVGVNLLNTNESSKSAATFYSWNNQAETGSIATSPIATTTAAVTRAKDFVNIGPITLVVTNIMSMSADVKLAVTQPSNAQALLFNMYRSSTDQFSCYLTTAQKLVCGYVDSGSGGGPTPAVATVFAANAAHHISTKYDGATWTACVDGAGCQTASTVFNVANVSETNFGLMSDGLSGVGATGWISNICVDTTSTGCT